MTRSRASTNADPVGRLPNDVIALGMANKYRHTRKAVLLYVRTTRLNYPSSLHKLYHITMSIDAELPAGVQTVAATAPLEYVIRLLKRDGGVFVKNFITEEDADKAYSECRERIDNDMAWEGNFFPSEYTR